MPVAEGDTVVIQVGSLRPLGGGGAGSGLFRLTLALEAPVPASANDLFADRLEIGVPTYEFEGGIYGATSEAGEPLPAGTSQTLWWKLKAPEAGVLALWPSAAPFTPILTLYEGSSLGSLARLEALSGDRYRLAAGQAYSLQIATGKVPVGVTLASRFFSVTNDAFASSTRFEGTSFAYAGNFTTATLEPGEPQSGHANTIWISWVPPFTGRARFTRSVVGWAPSVVVYTGPTVEHLQRVRVVDMANSRYDFLAVEGTVYHFQVSGRSDECTLSLQLLAWKPATNDFFANAGLQSFSLLAGQPQFAVGRITLTKCQPEGVFVWLHQGEPTFHYLIERAVDGSAWRPYLVLPDVTGTVTFTDSADRVSSVVLYRSRILD